MWRRKTGNARPNPDAAVITVKCSSTASSDGKAPATYKEALECMRREANLKDFGIIGTSVRVSRDGGIVITLPHEPEARNKACALVDRVKDKMPEGVKVACPQRTADVLVQGLDPSVSEEEVILGIAAINGCRPTDISHSGIRTSGDHMGRVWLKCPAAAAQRTAAAGSLRVGWSIARVSVARPKPIQCFRCLDFGHMRGECVSPFNRSNECYRCGSREHKIADCPSVLSKCAICPPGSNAHKTGSPSCAALIAAVNMSNRKGRRKRATLPPLGRSPTWNVSNVCPGVSEKLLSVRPQLNLSSSSSGRKILSAIRKPRAVILNKK